MEAFALLIPTLKKQKFATSGTGARRMTSDVKEEVWERDGGRCTYVGEAGRHCDSSWQVEFGHIIDVACGGDSTAGNIRCLCRAHNQLEAELRFGARFMEEKRRQAIEARAGRIEMKKGTRAGAGDLVSKPSAPTCAGAIVKSEDRTRAGAGEPATKPTDSTCAGAETWSPDLQPERERSPLITAA